MPTRPCQLSSRNFASIAAIRSNGATGLPIEFAADLLDQMHQRLQRQPGVGKDVGASGNALIGLDIDQHQRRGVDHAERVLHGPRDRARRPRAVTLRMAGTDLLMLVSSFHTVPPHQPRCGPVGGNGFDQISVRDIRRQRRCAGSGRARSPACRARTASSRRRAGRAAGSDDREDERCWRSRPGCSGPAPRCGRLWRGRPAATLPEVGRQAPVVRAAQRKIEALGAS